MKYDVPLLAAWPVQVTAELDSVAEALFGMDQQASSGQVAPVPGWQALRLDG